MAKEIQLNLPDPTYDRLLRVAKGPEGMAREIIAAIETRLAEGNSAGNESILSIVGIGDGEPGLSESVDDILYGPRKCS